jgi:cell division control protein 7
MNLYLSKSCSFFYLALDIWSVGVILLCFLSGRFPFFNSDDDLEALLEIAVVFGQREMAAVAATFSKSNLKEYTSLRNIRSLFRF